MSIGIELAGKEDRLPASVFIRSFENFFELLKDVDSSVSHRKNGSARWDVVTLTKNSPARAEIDGKTRLKAGDYVPTIQYALIDGLYQLSRATSAPEQPENYSYSALTKVRAMAIQAKRLYGFNAFTEAQHVPIDQHVFANVEYLIGTGGISMGSIRGSLDAITVHSGHEFRIWPSKGVSKKPVACRFPKAMFADVITHIKSDVEVFGRIRRNAKGHPVFMNVEQFEPLEQPARIPSIQELSGLLPDTYDGLTLAAHMDFLRNG